MRRAVEIWRRVPLPLWALLGAVVVIGAVGLRWELPWLTRDGGVRVATPVPPQGFGLSTVALERGKPVCIQDVLLPAATQVVSLSGSVPSGKPGPPVAVTIAGPGYRHTATIARGWPEGLRVTIPSPPRDVLATICLESRAKDAALLNANGTTVARAFTTVDGQRGGPVVAVDLLRSAPESHLARLGTMLDRAADFSWRPLSGGLARVLLALVLLLVPIGAVGALLWTMELDRRQSAPPAPPDADPAANAYPEGP
jgi:hypothetical protein